MILLNNQSRSFDELKKMGFVYLFIIEDNLILDDIFIKKPFSVLIDNTNNYYILNKNMINTHIILSNFNKIFEIETEKTYNISENISVLKMLDVYKKNLQEFNQL